MEGYKALMAQRWGEAARYFETLYAQSPQFLGGAVARHLYEIYLEQGKAHETEKQYTQAVDRYRLAASLPVSDTSEARRRIDLLLPMTIPTATPTATPTAEPSPTPTSVPLPLSAYRGWIAFKTVRDGGGSVYVMRPDGRSPRPVSDPENFVKLEEQEAYSPDGTRRVYNEGETGNKQSTPLYIWRYDLPPTWERRRQLLDNSTINYQPVWSPQGNLIAFVSQKTGNDEIWVINADEREEHPTPRRLTFNDWEWDKHPTWSPDGQYIVFWSNRETGRPQIWIMRADGSNPVNISRNEYNDWDPVWIK
jgi:TolB protein